MTALSPLAQRLIAIGLFVLFTLLAINLMVVPTSELVSRSLNRLEDANFRLARVEALRDQPTAQPGPDVPEDLLIKAPTPSLAADSLSGYIAALANANGAQLQSIAPVQATDKKTRNVEVAIALQGDQDKVLAFVSQLEGGRPLVRFKQWSLTAAAPQAGQTSTAVQLSLSATVTAAWIAQ